MGSKYDSITLSFDHFHFHPTAQLVPDLILTLCQTKIAERESSYHSDFLSSRKFIIFANFSFSSRNWGKEFWFFFLLSKTGQENSRFLFLLSRRGKGIRISLSPLECGEIVFKFLFLFSIGIFCISSMTAPHLKIVYGFNLINFVVF